MKFKYQAKTKEGESQVGYVEAGSREAAINILAGHNLFILSLEEAEKVRWYERLANYFSRVRRKDLMIFTRQLAILLEARLALNNILRILHEQTTQPILKEAVFQIAEDVDSGLAFSQALERQPMIFSRFFISMIRSAEVSGNLENVGKFLADYLEQDYNLFVKSRSALIYPSLVIGLFIAVAFLIMTFVLPPIGPIFAQAGVPLPLFSQIILNIGNFFQRWWLLVLFILMVVLMMALEYFQTPEGQAVKDDLKVRLPIIRSIHSPLVLAHFSNTAAMLLRGGIPVVQSVEIAAETVDNVLYKEIFHQIAEAVRQGQTLSESFSKYPEHFPVMVPQMLAVGEATGQIDKTFNRLADFYGHEAESAINNIVDLIQPVLLVGIGVLVGLLFASILLPLYQLVGTIH